MFSVFYDTRRRTNSTEKIIHDKTFSPISDHPDIPWFLLLDDPAHKLFLSAGLGTYRIRSPEHPKPARDDG